MSDMLPFLLAVIAITLIAIFGPMSLPEKTSSPQVQKEKSE